jgi:hypothetical protein
MTKFNIKVETRQAWTTEVEAKTVEEAHAIRDEFGELLQEYMKNNEEDMNFSRSIPFKLQEFKCGFSAVEPQNDLTKLETTKAFRTDSVEGYQDTAFCPYCEAENSDNLILGGTDKKSSDFDTDEANAKMFHCSCISCGGLFRVDYFKGV